MVTWAMVACGKCAPQDTGCVSCMCLAAQHGTRVLKVVNCHKTPCKPVCQWPNAYWLGLSQGYFTDDKGFRRDGRAQSVTETPSSFTSLDKSNTVQLYSVSLRVRQL